jgi:hypothetical protein
MKFTEYFTHIRQRPDRIRIMDDWIMAAIENPDHRAVQQDGRIRLWKRIEEAEGRWLRVILLADGKTVHNAFFDRRFKES